MQSKPPNTKTVERIARTIQYRRYGVCDAMDLICLYDTLTYEKDKKELVGEIISAIDDHFPPKEHAPNMVFASPATNWMMIVKNKLLLVLDNQLEFADERISIDTALEDALQFLTKEEINLEGQLTLLNE